MSIETLLSAVIFTTLGNWISMIRNWTSPSIGSRTILNSGADLSRTKKGEIRRCPLFLTEQDVVPSIDRRWGLARKERLSERGLQWRGESTNIVDWSAVTGWSTSTMNGFGRTRIYCSVSCPMCLRFFSLIQSVREKEQLVFSRACFLVHSS